MDYTTNYFTISLKNQWPREALGRRHFGLKAAQGGTVGSFAEGNARRRAYGVDGSGTIERYQRLRSRKCAIVVPFLHNWYVRYGHASFT